MGKEKEYDKYYSVPVCPYCKHSEMIKNDKLFSLIITYKCCKCSREFESKDFLSVAPKDEVKRLVQDGLNGRITQFQMKEGFEKIGINIYIPFPTKKRAK